MGGVTGPAGDTGAAPEIGSGTDPGPATSRPGMRIGIQIARVLLAGLLLTQVAAVAWLLTRDGNIGSLIADLRAGRVTVLEIGDVPATTGAEVSLGPDRVLVRWRTSDGGWHDVALSATGSGGYGYEVTDPFGEPEPKPLPPGGDQLARMLPDDPALVRMIAEAYAPHRDAVTLRAPDDNPVQLWLLVSGAVWLVMVVVLIAGPQSARATRWAWFWLYATPLGIGMLAALAVDAPWSKPAQRERRLTGWPGFGVMVVAALLWGQIRSHLMGA